MLSYATNKYAQTSSNQCINKNKQNSSKNNNNNDKEGLDNLPEQPQESIVFTKHTKYLFRMKMKKKMIPELKLVHQSKMKNQSNNKVFNDSNKREHQYLCYLVQLRAESIFLQMRI